MDNYWTNTDNGKVTLIAGSLWWQGDSSITTHEKIEMNTEALQEHPLVEVAAKPHRSPNRYNARRGFVKLIDGYVFSDNQGRMRCGGPQQLLKDMKLVVEGEDKMEKWERENPA